jgi:hypothetical protein
VRLSAAPLPGLFIAMQAPRHRGILAGAAAAAITSCHACCPANVQQLARA